jgi:anti-anti-sigma factor
VTVNCTTQIDGAKGILRLEGRFTFEAGADVKAKASAILGTANVKELDLDFQGVTFLESSALGILLLLREQAEAKGTQMVLLNPSAAVRAALEAVQFGKLFEIR